MFRPAEQAAAISASPSAVARRVIVAGFGVAYVSLLVVGMVDTLVWMPQYIAPTTPLSRIYSVLADAGSLRGVVLSPVLWLLFWAAVGSAYLVLFLPVRPRFRPAAAAVSLSNVIGIGLVVFGAMAFFQWWSGFAMGMEVSDDLPPGVGASTPFSLVCLGGGFLIALTGGAVWLASTARATRSRRRALGTAK